MSRVSQDKQPPSDPEQHSDGDDSRRAAPRAPRPLEFVEVNPSQRVPRQVRKQIRSHVMRGIKHPKAGGLDSEKSKRFFSAMPRGAGSHSSLTAQSSAMVTARSTEEMVKEMQERSPDQHIDLIRFTSYPSPLELSAVEMSGKGYVSHKTLLQSATLMRYTTYPVDTMWDTSGEISWVYHQTQDPLFLHCYLFLYHGTQDAIESMAKGQTKAVVISNQSQQQLDTALTLLQERVRNINTKTLNSTIASVGGLCMMAVAAKDELAFESHMGGLARMLRLAGGLKAFYGTRDDRRSWAVMCRMSLAWYCKKGYALDWLDSDIPFCDRSFEDPKVKESLAVSVVLGRGIHSITPELDPQLHAVFLAMRRRTEMRTGYQPGQVFPSLLYFPFLSTYPRQLTKMSYSIDKKGAINEALRLGLIGCILSFLLAVSGVPEANYAYLSARIRSCTESLDASTSSAARNLKLWVLIISSMASVRMEEPWLLKQVAELTTGLEWDEVSWQMQDILWLPSTQERLGKRVFMASQKWAEKQRSFRF